MSTIPFTPFFHSPVIIIDVEFDQLQVSCEYCLKYAQLCTSYELDDASIIRQSYHYQPFYIDLVNLETQKNLEFGFEIHEKQLFMFFMLEGNMMFKSIKHRPIAHAREDHFRMSYYDEGKFLVQVKPGKHIALVISISPHWATEIGSDFEQIRSLLTEFEHELKSFHAYCQGKINRKVGYWIKEIYGCEKLSKGVFDGHIRKYIAHLIEYYNEVLKYQREEIEYQAVNFLEENFCRPEITNKYLADKFNVTPETLSKYFKREFNITVNEYLTRLRMEYAEQLMINEGLPLKDVYMKVGYHNLNTFRIAFNSYRNRN